MFAQSHFAFLALSLGHHCCLAHCARLTLAALIDAKTLYACGGVRRVGVMVCAMWVAAVDAWVEFQDVFDEILVLFEKFDLDRDQVLVPTSMLAFFVSNCFGVSAYTKCRRPCCCREQLVKRGMVSWHAVARKQLQRPQMLRVRTH